MPVSSKEEDKEILNILPSYHMYKSTVSRNLTPSQENFKIEPPTYELTPSNSVPQSMVTSPLQSPPNELESTDSFHQPVIDTVNEAADNLWENTILANVHKLKNLTDTDNKISNNLDINIHVTEKVCQKGVEPIHMDPLLKEFQQGDYIHGYVTIENKSKTPIPFDMVYVVFEGSTIVLDTSINGVLDAKKPKTVYKFLNMIDLFASWSYANIDRLVSDNGDPHDWCNGETDPYDNTILAIDVNRIFQPNIKYKRYFTFRIPDKLLDDACEMHDLTRHQEVPPSIGKTRSAVRTIFEETGTNPVAIKDFAPIDTSISYSVDARVIGKASDYEFKSTSSTGDEYIVAKDVSVPIRIVPLLSSERQLQLSVNNEETQLFYRAFLDCVKNKINLGRELLNLQPILSNSANESGGSGFASFPDLTPMNSIDNNSFIKIRQLYDASAGLDSKPEVLKLKVPRKSVKEEQYQSFLTYKKKSLTGLSKSSGILSLSTPKAEYRISYRPPMKYRPKVIDPRNNVHLLTIPMELQFLVENGKSSSSSSSSSSHVSLPEIKEITTDLTVFTVRSKKHPIPVELSHDLLFNDQEVEGSKALGNDNFDTIVVRKFQNYLHEMTDLIKKIGPEIFLVENRLFNDLKSMAFLNTKYINLSISDVTVSTSQSGGTSSKNLNTVPWQEGEGADITEHQGYTLYLKKFSLNVDTSKAHFKGLANNSKTESCILPDFQSCLIARLYYLRICFKTTTNQTLTVNVPVVVENLGGV